MSTTPTAAPRLQIVQDVTDWPQTLIDTIMRAIAAARAELAARAGDATDEEVESTGWTKELADRALDSLTSSRATVQIKVIKRAIENSGVVLRDEVYKIGGYDESRSLKGFTRAANRATLALRDSGELPEDAEELLEPIYDDTIRGYQRAKGFRIPAEIVKLYTE